MESVTKFLALAVAIVCIIATIVFGVNNFFIPIFTTFIQSTSFGALFIALIKLAVSTFIGTMLVVIEFMVFLWMYAMVDMM